MNKKVTKNFKYGTVSGSVVLSKKGLF